MANSSQCNCIYINIEGYAVNDDIQYVADVWWQIGESYVCAAYLEFKMLLFKF